jgi:hypothetical protein
MIKRAFAVAVPLVVLLAAPQAYAQSSPNKNWCLQGGSGALECSYTSFTECEKARSGNVGTCVQNEGQR